MEVLEGPSGELSVSIEAEGARTAATALPFCIMHRPPASPRQEGGGGMTFAAQVQDWSAGVLVLKLRDPASRRRYTRLVETIAAKHGWASAADATYSQVLAHLAAARETSRGKTVNNHLGILRSFFAHAKSAGWRCDDPSAAVDFVEEQDSEDGARAFTAEEVRALLAIARRPSEDRRRTSDRYYVYLVMASTPLRCSSIRRLRTRDFIDRGRDASFSLPRAAVKKSAATQLLPLPAECAAAVRAWIASRPKAAPESPLFPRVPEWRTLLADLKAAGVPVERAGFNSLRKYFMTAAARISGPLALNALTQHKDVRTTLRHYVDPAQLEAEAVVAALPPLLGGRPGRGGATASDRGGDKAGRGGGGRQKSADRGLDTPQGGAQTLRRTDRESPVNDPQTNSETAVPRPRSTGRSVQSPSRKAGRGLLRPAPANPMTPWGFEPQLPG